MRSQQQRVIEINKVRSQGELPAFLGVMVRHFEKSRPTVVSAQEATLTAQVDLLGMLLPSSLVNEIDSMEIEFRKDSK